MLNQDSVKQLSIKQLSIKQRATNQHAAIEAFSFRVVRTRCHDEFERRADECRRLAAAARSDADRTFWLGLVARWQAVERKRPILMAPRRQARLRAVT